MKPVAIIALIALAWATPASASDWRLGEVTTTEDGLGVGYIDAESINRSGQSVTFWIFVVYQRAAAGMDNFRALMEADCNTRAYRMLQMTTYLSERRIRTIGPTGLKYAIPDTTQDGMIKTACGDEPLDDLAVKDPYSATKEVVGELETAE